jgi:hypothetical protein
LDSLLRFRPRQRGLKGGDGVEEPVGGRQRDLVDEILRGGEGCADDAVTERRPTRVGYAKSLIRQALENGAIPSAELDEIMAAERISDRTVSRARAELGVVSQRVYDGSRFHYEVALPTPTKDKVPTADGAL